MKMKVEVMLDIHGDILPFVGIVSVSKGDEHLDPPYDVEILNLYLKDEQQGLISVDELLSFDPICDEIIESAYERLV